MGREAHMACNLKLRRAIAVAVVLMLAACGGETGVPAKGAQKAGAGQGAARPAGGGAQKAVAGKRTAAGAQDVLGALMNAALTFQPTGMAGKGLSPASLAISPAEWVEIAQVFPAVLKVIRASGARRTAYLAKLKAQGVEEEPMSEAGVAFQVNVMNNRFAFDRYGHLYFDDRFVTKEERPALDRAEALYRKFHKRWMAANAGKVKKDVKGKGEDAVKGKDAKVKGEVKAKPKGETEVAQQPGAIVDRAAEWKVRRVPIFKGFEDDRYQEHDALIVRCVDEFNRNRAAGAGATAEQAKGIPAITTALVKSHMIEETGGRDQKSLAAWDVDPEQVNVPGDWSDAKKDLGLAKPSKRNEGTAEQNIRAAIRFLSRKGFGASGQKASNRPAGRFDDWQTALKRYNGRSDAMVDGKSYSETYAEHIVERAKDPGKFVAIRKVVKK
jgi:hypothetical protein